jgi:signal transduction histidine kinase/CheY-like chemotaxis protein
MVGYSVASVSGGTRVARNCCDGQAVRTAAGWVSGASDWRGCGNGRPALQLHADSEARVLLTGLKVEHPAQAERRAEKARGAPLILRALGDLKVPQRIRFCVLLCIAAGLLPSLVLLLKLRPGDPASIEKATLTSLVVWTVVAQLAGLLVAGLMGRQIFSDIGNSLRRLGELVAAISAGKTKEAVSFEYRADEIGALAEALHHMIKASDDDRYKLIQGNVALVLSNERLALANMELEAANAKVRQLAEQAGTANVAKRSFLAVVSHEIRTPVNGIIGMTELALKTPLNAMQRDYLETVNGSAQALLGLLNDILDFSKIEAGKLELEMVDFSLRDTLDDAVAAYAPRFHARGVELILDVRPDVPDALIGDPHRLRQVTLNLISNAMRFTARGEVVVRVEVAEGGPVETLLRFTVTDTGCGIPPEKREAIFDAFTQADNSTTRRFGGTGLGLAICKQLTQLMGGWISVQSELGKGSEFQFRVRFGVGTEAARTEPAALAGKRVLVVESHARNARLLAEMLAGWRLDVEIVNDAAMGGLHLTTATHAGKKFDFVIADTFRPESGGAEIAAQLAAMRGAPRLLLLMPAAKRDEFPSLPPGTVMLTKPVRARKLRAALENAPQPQSSEPAAANQHPHGRQLRILIAEDHATNQRIVRTHLENWGHVVVTADDGTEAVELVAMSPFDLIFMDLQMPLMDGIAATASIRQREKRGERVPIVALTANVLKGVREECLAAGMDGYLGKPVREHELLSMLESLVPGLDQVADIQKTDASNIATLVVPDAMGMPFDVASLLSSMNGDRRVLAGLLRDSRDGDIPEIDAELTDALAARDASRVRRAAHAMKGVIGVFYAPQAYQAAKRLEESAREGKLDLCDKQVLELRATVSNLLTSLERFLSGPASQAA